MPIQAPSMSEECIEEWIRMGFNDEEALAALREVLSDQPKPPKNCLDFTADARKVRLAVLEWAKELGVEKYFDERVFTSEKNPAHLEPTFPYLLKEIQRLNELALRCRQASDAKSLGRWVRTHRPSPKARITKPSILFSNAGGIALKPSHSADDLFLLKSVLDERYQLKERNDCFMIERMGDSLAENRITDEGFEHLKISMCGTGESEYSAVVTMFVEERLEAFCSLKQFDRAALERFRKSFRLISKLAISRPRECFSYRLTYAADGERNRAKAIRLRKEALFWFGVAFADDEKWLEEEDTFEYAMIKLDREQNIPD
jgi:hypothetical protein